MFPVDQNHIDSELNNGGYSSRDSELVNLRPSSGQTLLNAKQLQQQQQQSQTKSPAVTVDTKQQNHNTQSNSNAKKSVMLNLKSGAINSTVEEFTRFSDTFTTNRRRNRVWLIAIAIAIGCLCCFAFGLSFNYLFDTQPCDGKCSIFHDIIPIFFVVLQIVRNTFRTKAERINVWMAFVHMGFACLACVSAYDFVCFA